MHIHYLQHVPFEGIASMEGIFVERGCNISRTSLHEHQALPSIHDIDVLIVMGGPMGVNDEEKYAWLTLEKEFIEAAIQRGIPVLGICLGAQLIANVLGAKVKRNHCEEIGWYPIKRTQTVEDKRVRSFPSQFTALHWHGDTFEIPSGASNFLASEGCANQGFIYGEATLGLQFHLELLPSHVQAIYHECGQPDKQGDYLQSLDDMLASAEKFQTAHKITKQLVEDFIFEKKPQ